MGAGTITIPYVFYANGLFLGTFFIFLGAFLSFYTGVLIALCAEETGGGCYEEIAFKIYGEKGLKFTSFCNVCANVGFCISYVVLFKNMMPYTIELMMGLNNRPDFRKGLDPEWSEGKKLAHWIGNTSEGHIVWASIFTFICLFPISLPR